MPLTATDRLSREDSQILKLGRDAIRGHTCKVIVLERAAGTGQLPTLEALRAHIEARLARAPRFRQRVVQTPLRVAAPVWIDDTEFDIRRHVTRVPAEGPVDRPALQEIVARRMEKRLDRAHPLWQLDVLERLNGDAMALIWRVHHCLADGTTCVRLASSLLWDDPSAPLPPSERWRPEPPPHALTLLAAGVRARDWGRRERLRPRTLSSLPAMKRTMARELRRAAAPTRFAGAVGPERRVAFAQVPLSAVRAAGKAIGESVTVNDVVLSIIAGALHVWMPRAGDTAAIRVKVPVSLHHPGEAETVGNRNSYFVVDLPVHEADPIARVRAINRETRERKLAHDAETLYRLGLHPLVARWAMSPRVFTFNVSNVPGPPSEVLVLGARVRELYTLAEIAQHHALRVAVISAAGSLFLGLCADRAAITDLNQLAAEIQRASEELLALAAPRPSAQS